MSSAFFIGLSGLKSNSFALNVIGNNLSNLNTIGFKGSTASFQDLIQSSLARDGAGNPFQTGIGSGVAGVSSVFTQGSLQTTQQATDMAIVGNGFFVVSDGQRNFYTRAGNFTLDGQGNLRTLQGLFVQGYQAADGVINPSDVRNIRLTPGTSVPPKVTSQVGLDLNLNADAKVGDKFSATIDVYDTLGTAHTLTYTFTKADSNKWDYSITVPGVDVGSKNATEEISKGSLTFDNKGVLTAPSADVANLKISNLANGAADVTFTWQIKDSSGAPKLSQFAAPSNTSGASQDGYSFGSLLGFVVDSQGVLQGAFSNSQVRPLGQVLMANFNNPQGLLHGRNNTFEATESSGEPVLGTAGSGGRGAVTGNALELSNVDIAEEFTSMILAQRGYQASSRIITTADQIIQEAINLIR